MDMEVPCFMASIHSVLYAIVAVACTLLHLCTRPIVCTRSIVCTELQVVPRYIFLKQKLRLLLQFGVGSWFPPQAAVKLEAFIIIKMPILTAATRCLTNVRDLRRTKGSKDDVVHRLLA